MPELDDPCWTAHVIYAIFEGHSYFFLLPDAAGIQGLKLSND
jgi:hypothetical protein